MCHFILAYTHKGSLIESSLRWRMAFGWSCYITVSYSTVRRICMLVVKAHLVYFFNFFIIVLWTQNWHKKISKKQNKLLIYAGGWMILWNILPDMDTKSKHQPYEFIYAMSTNRLISRNGNRCVVGSLERIVGCCIYP